MGAKRFICWAPLALAKGYSCDEKCSEMRAEVAKYILQSGRIWTISKFGQIYLALAKGDEKCWEMRAEVGPV